MVYQDFFSLREGCKFFDLCLSIVTKGRDGRKKQYLYVDNICTEPEASQNSLFVRFLSLPAHTKTK